MSVAGADHCRRTIYFTAGCGLCGTPLTQSEGGGAPMVLLGTFNRGRTDL